ncbi:hypothetical protein ACFWA5_02975 [Streptomyces mirabilis]|uniref:hypothetical protein n=1 Tax=Streptomyces mirabilis TaxID=68239 RepID=UPI0036526946
MAMSHDVRFWDTRERPDRRKSLQIRWTVNGREKSESFIAFALAHGRRAKLMTAARNSLPVSALAEADVLRRDLDAMSRKLDGKAAAVHERVAARQPG